VLKQKPPVATPGVFIWDEEQMPSKMRKSTARSRELRLNRLQFAAKVRAARAVLGWSQTELAERTGLTQHAIYQVEQGAVDARMSTTTAISAALNKAGISFEDMLDNGFRITVPLAS
jgi:DNA-binding XRE family transcriptional regulator